MQAGGLHGPRDAVRHSWTVGEISPNSSPFYADWHTEVSDLINSSASFALLGLEGTPPGVFYNASVTDIEVPRRVHAVDGVPAGPAAGGCP